MIPEDPMYGFIREGAEFVRFLQYSRKNRRYSVHMFSLEQFYVTVSLFLNGI